MLLFVISVFLYVGFVYIVTSQSVPLPILSRRQNASSIHRCLAAILLWPLAGFLFFWLGVFLNWMGQILMMPVGVAVRLVMMLW